jgi:hypothetical protein
LVLTFGLGVKTKADSIEIEWPSGQVERLSNISASQTVTIQEGKGVMGSRPYQTTKHYDRGAVRESHTASLSPENR